ncbi:MAG: hypothetical protein JWN46_2482 [Acidimicrobiales bacterium]|nr:hypothetical protein [Acidimicrobiales bacterium]
MSEPGEPEPHAEPAVDEPFHHAVEGAQHIVGVAFGKPTRADEVLLSLVHLQMEGEIALADAVVVVKTLDDRVHVRQTVDVTAGRGALSGSMWGILVGVLFGGPFLPLGIVAGAAAGALTATLVDIGLDDKWIKEVGRWLDPGTSALLLLVNDDMRPSVLQELERFEGRVLYCTFPGQVRTELERALRDSRFTSGDGGSEPPPVPGPADG